MKILITEKQYKILMETSSFNYSAKPRTKKDSKAEFNKVINNENLTLVKKINNISFYYEIFDDMQLKISALDENMKMSAGYAILNMINADTYQIEMVYVYDNYRDRGIAIEMYMIALTFGDLVSGNEQSQYGIRLWKKLYKVLPNKFVAVKDGKEYKLSIDKNGEFIVKEKTSINISDDPNIHMKIHMTGL